MSPTNWIKEISAATADLGTFLPLCLGLVVIAGMDPVGLLFGFGVFAIATAVIYRRPIPVQPMKAVAAMGIAGIASPEVMIATGVMLGFALVTLSCTDAIGRLRRLVPKTVLHGMRLALALSLCLMIADLDIDSGLVIVLLGLMLIGLLKTPFAAVASLAVVVMGWFVFGDASSSGDLRVGIHVPSVQIPNLAALISAGQTVFFPQLALTLTNALILTAVIAQDYFPDDCQKLTERNFARSSGVANILLAPFGAMPMCHGAGGLAAYHGLGAKTGWPIGVFGFVCLTGAIVLGDQMVVTLVALPGEVIAVLLGYAAWVLADPMSIVKVRSSCLWVIGAMVAITFLSGPMIALLSGVALEYARSRFFGVSSTVS